VPPFLVLIVLLSLLIFSVILYIIWKVRWGLPRKHFPRVLAYHKVTRFELGGTWMPPKRFISQIDFLLDRGYRFIGEDEFIQTLEGRRKGNGKEILLTFDDGYEELMSTAAPVLRSRGIPALIFLVSSYIGRENEWELHLPWRRFRHLDWDEIDSLRGMGFTFGSHSMTHRDLTRLSSRELIEELAESKDVIGRRLGTEVKSLSYPFGRVDSRVRRAAGEAGYRAAFSMCPPSRNSIPDPMMLRREGVYVIDGRFSISNKLKDGGLFWLEDIKGRAINSVAVLTPFLKGKALP